MDYASLMKVSVMPGAWLCGSREFNRRCPERVLITEETDFDYHLPATQEVIKELLLLGYEYVAFDNPYINKFSHSLWVFNGFQVVLDFFPKTMEAIFREMSIDTYLNNVRKGPNISRDYIKSFIERLCEEKLWDTQEEPTTNNRLILDTNIRLFEMKRVIELL